MSTLHELYLSEIKQASGRALSSPPSTFTLNDIAGLPEPIRRYFITCGYLGTEKHLSALLRWRDAKLKLSPFGKWHRIKCYQFNAVPEPTRIVHMNMKLGGVLPLEARDKYQDGHGNMLIRLLRRFTLRDVEGPEMDASALVTVLAETLLLPAYALQPYIHWSPIAADHAAVEINWAGITAHGIFYFNDRGEFTRFETCDRWRSEKKTKLHQTAWSIRVSDYITNMEGIRYPSRATAAWWIGGQWMDYFQGTITGVGVMATK